MSDQLRISAAFSILAMVCLALFPPSAERFDAAAGVTPIAAAAGLPALDLPQPALLDR